MRRFPRIPEDLMAPMLHRLADKAERGEALQVGESAPGVRHIEGDIVAAVLRAVADDRSPRKVLLGDGPPPRSRHEVMRRVRDETRRHGGGRGAQARAFEAIAKAEGTSVAAVKADHARAKREERDHWRRKYMSGHWPSFRHWRMSDTEIEAQAQIDRTGRDAQGKRVDFAVRYVDTDGNEIDARDVYRRRRDAEMAIFTQATGWPVPPPRNGDKSPPG